MPFARELPGERVAVAIGGSGTAFEFPVTGLQCFGVSRADEFRALFEQLPDGLDAPGFGGLSCVCLIALCVDAVGVTQQCHEKRGDTKETGFHADTGTFRNAAPE